MEMKLWRAANAAGIFAWTSRLYSGASNKIRNRRFKTPKIRSIALRADEWRKLNNSSLLRGLDLHH
jgi:hypothetical protein